MAGLSALFLAIFILNMSKIMVPSLASVRSNAAIFIAVSILAIAFLIFLFSSSGRQKIYQILLGMLLAGVLGNFYDRIVYGHVRDMIHIFPRWPNLYPWVFNVADSLLCVGVALMLVYSFVYGEKQSDEPSIRPIDDAASH